MQRGFGMLAVKRRVHLGTMSHKQLYRLPNVGEVTRPVGCDME